jgi:hypothetical protein
MAVSPEGIRGVDAEYRPPQNRCQIAFGIGDRDDEMTHDVNDLIGMRDGRGDVTRVLGDLM